MTKPRDKLILSNRIDVKSMRRRFADRGRVHIPELFDAASAERIGKFLNQNMRWNLVTDNNGKHLDLDAAGMSDLSKDSRKRFFDIVHDQAKTKFQYLFNNYPIYDVYHHKTAPAHFLNEVFEFLNGHEFLTLVRTVTDDPSIGFADAQATCYEPGHFLTTHDDNVAGKLRCSAYVLNFTRNWNPDWGGVTQFFSADGHIEEAFVPGFNALNLFQVPQRHSVSIVAPFAMAARLSITGWLRAGRDPLLAPPQRAKQNLVSA